MITCRSHIPIEVDCVRHNVTLGVSKIHMIPENISVDSYYHVDTILENACLSALNKTVWYKKTWLCKLSNYHRVFHPAKKILTKFEDSPLSLAPSHRASESYWLPHIG